MNQKITGTFLDEISHDIPHQNWGEKEWDEDFLSMKAVGIDTVILIRCGCGFWLTYPSQVLMQKEQAYRPSVDLVDMYLRLSEKHGMAFYFGTYDSQKYWHDGNYEKEVDLNLAVVDEVWKRYGHRKAFKGWYLCQEVSRRTSGIIDTYAKVGKHCKAISNNKLPVLISPWMDGVKAVDSSQSTLGKADAVSLRSHKSEWREVFAGIKEAVDIVAFQDGHVDYHELPLFLRANKELADEFGLACWTNTESFDRDMPIKFLPIKWEKLLLKLEAAKQAGIENAITFEFSHFMSPNSAYPQARHLYNRYREYLDMNSIGTEL